LSQERDEDAQDLLWNCFTNWADTLERIEKHKSSTTKQ